jgi:biotin carboxylase
MAIERGKKLLILGGSSLMVDPVLRAKSLGIYTIVTDWHELEKSPAKRVADEYWNISLMDYDLLVAKIKEENVNGILTGFTDAFLLSYQHLCELTGLPCYASKEAFETCIDKSKFKDLCRSNGVPVIPEYSLDTFDPNSITENNKIIIKPVDNSGSQGVILCKESKDFHRCLDYALSFSKKKQVIIERYMEMDSFAASYTIQDGIISLSTLNDRLEHKSSETAAITCAGIYPSKYLDLFLRKMDGKLKSMYRSLGVTNGVLSVQGFVDGEEFYVMEMGYRLTGGQHYIFSKYENGISALEQLIHFAITGKMADFSIAERDNPRFKDLCVNLCILGRSARIDRIEGKEFILGLPEVINASFLKDVGDEIGRDGTTAQKIANLHLVFKDINDLKRVTSSLQRNFHAYDEKGNDLVIPFFT